MDATIKNNALAVIIFSDIIVMILVIFTSRRIFNEKRRDLVTYAAELGVQNTALEILIGYSVLRWDERGVVAVIYGLVNYALIAGLIYVVSKIRRVPAHSI